MVTPLDHQGRLDSQMAKRLAGWLVERGIDGIFVGGTTGEGLLLSLEERKQLLEAVVDAVGGKAAVLTQVGCANTADSMALAEHAAAAGADAIVILSPFFFTVDKLSMVAHFAAIARAVANTPVYLYNIPGNTRNSITTDIITSLAVEVTNLAGIKDSSKDLVLLQKFVKTAPPGFAVIVGSDSVLLPGLAVGAEGVVSAASNVFPEAVVDVVRKYEAGDLEGARQAQRYLNGLLDVLKVGPTLAGYKAGLALRGMPVGGLRTPLRDMTPEEKSRFTEAFEAINYRQGG
jgi:2-dehydro-3-deoxy-phosphogluconate/2-dehydro-3-deoxy-6-phosphogalactonate aldolase